MADQGLELLGGERPQQLRLLTWGMGEGVPRQEPAEKRQSALIIYELDVESLSAPAKIHWRERLDPFNAKTPQEEHNLL
ncbi:MAG: hypothetical protein LQ352_007409 [Teloschistes flavicans]|nr:MAG: hypothetical protein LQ352_007409 [Teloschistes flavicans]